MNVHWRDSGREVILGHVGSGMFSCVVTCEIMCFKFVWTNDFNFYTELDETAIFIGKNDH